MKSREMNFFLHHLAEVDSTNRYINDEADTLWRMAGDAADALVVTAHSQTSGRGQRGNVWHSNAGENLLVSILVRPQYINVKEQFSLSQVAALAVKATMKHFGIDVALKWPNDIYVGNKKLCGMLLELQYCNTNIEQAVIGIGLNINQEQFVEMDKIPVSMYQLTGCKYNINDVLDVLLSCFSYYYRKLLTGNRLHVALEYKESLLGVGVAMNYRDKNGSFVATIINVENDGHLLLQRTCGELSRYAFKEVELLL